MLEEMQRRDAKMGRIVQPPLLLSRSSKPHAQQRTSPLTNALCDGTVDHVMQLYRPQQSILHWKRHLFATQGRYLMPQLLFEQSL